MAQVVCVLGNSGSGKSASLRNFKKGEVLIFEVAGKPLPFKNDFGGFVRYTTNENRNIDYTYIINYINRVINSDAENKPKTIIIDDSQYLMAFENFDKAKIKGYDKYTDMALNFQNLIRTMSLLPDDYTVYFLHHINKDDDGYMHMKTLGKMLDNQLTTDGLFTTIIMATRKDKSYVFQVVDYDGISSVKTPIGLYEDGIQFIDNDLKAFDDNLRSFYNI